MPESSTFAHRLGALLRERRGGRTQADVSASVGISDSTYSDYERGNITPSFEMLLSLFEVLDIDAAELLAILDGDDDDEPNGHEKAA